MKSALQLRTFRYGSPPHPQDGLRIGTTRRPPRGVAREGWLDYFDVWFPLVAPSAKLLARFQPLGLEEAATRERFFAVYERELLAYAEGRQAVELLAEMARRTPISIGCYCADESQCHRSRLFTIIQRVAAAA